MTKFEELATIARKLNKMPVPYKTIKGNECETYYTTAEMLCDIVFKVGTNDNSVECEYRSLENSCLREMGFKYIAIYIDKLSDGRIAILGV